VATEHHQMWSERRVCFVLGCHVADEEKAALKKADEVSGGKDECQLRLNDDDCFHSFQQ